MVVNEKLIDKKVLINVGCKEQQLVLSEPRQLPAVKKKVFPKPKKYEHRNE
jgi:hypothetical protein